MSDLFTLRPAREGDWELINYYAYREGMDAIPSLENVTVAANGDDDCVGFCRLAFSEAGIAHVNPVVINEQWRGYGVGRALIDDARAHHDEIRLVARGKSIEFYRVLGFTEIPWDDIAPGVTEECDGCPLIEEWGGSARVRKGSGKSESRNTCGVLPSSRWQSPVFFFGLSGGARAQGARSGGGSSWLPRSAPRGLRACYSTRSAA